MDINSLASEFGSAGISPKTDSGIDVHSLVSEFGSKKKADEVKGLTKVYIDTTPKPPISGFDAETSNALNTRPEVKGGANPRDTALAEGISNLPSNVGSAVGQNFTDAYGNIKGGLDDAINKGKVGSGALRTGAGVLQGLVAAPSGLVSEAVEKPISELTGNPDIGSRAGFLAGAAIPIVPGAGAISKAIPSNVALKTLIEKIGPEDLPKVVSAMKANPRIGPADISPAVLSMTQKLFTTEGDHAKNYLKHTSDARMAGSKDAVEAAYDTATGLPVNAVTKLKELSDAAKEVGMKEINPAVADAKAVDLAPVLKHIDAQLKPSPHSALGESALPFTDVKKQLAQVRSWLADANVTRQAPEDLHKIQSAFRKEAENLLNSADGSDRALGHSLMEVRNKIVDAIDVSANGKYKPALSNYRDEKHIAEAFNDAYTGVFSSSKKMENRPEFTKEWIEGLTTHEKEAAKEGARLAIDSEIKSAKNGALAGTNLVKSDFNKQKLEMLFGKEEASGLLQKLDHERAIANTHNKIIENSQTAMRLAGESAVALPEKSTKNPLQKYALPALATGAEILSSSQGLTGAGLVATGLVSGAAKLGTAAKDAIALKLAKERNANIAKYALPTEGPDRDALIRQLEAAIPGPKQSLARRTAGTLSRLVSP